MVAKQGDQSVDGFESTGKKIHTVQELKKKLAAGDESVKNDLFLAELALGSIKYEDAKKQVTTLKLTEKQQASAGTLLLNLEVDWRQGQFPRISRRASAEQREAAMAKSRKMQAAAQASYLEHHNAKRFPSEKIAAYYFTDALIKKAVADKNVALFEGVYGKLKKLAHGDARFSRVWQHLDSELDKLKSQAEGGSGS